VESGARLRYEPIALVAHDHRTQLRDWLARKVFYGSSAAPLSARHPDKTAPLVISGSALAMWILLAIGSTIGYLASLAVAALTGRRIAKKMHGAEAQIWDVVVVAVRGLWSAALQLASAVCRHYWPIALAAAIVSRHCRRAVIIAAIIDGVVDWANHKIDSDGDTKPVGLLPYLALKRLDDLAYGLGVWGGVVRERNLRPLKPQIRT
jgi:mycofactocin system glycosyltransferase